MNSQLEKGRGAEYSSNLAIIKSQKILNSTSNYHLKTQQQQKNEEEHKSPQNLRNDFRQTSWRKPRMQYNKLPDVFQMSKKMQSTSQNKIKNNKQTVEKLNKIIKNGEFKEVGKLLEPINFEKKPQQKVKEVNQNGNPLIAYQKYLKIKSKFDEQMNHENMQINKYKSLSSKTITQNAKISECITLQVIKRGNNTGTIKKMLHVPTLKLICIREQPLNTKQSRNSIKQWISFWQNRLSYDENQRFITVHGTAFNYPEGAVSILTQYFKSGSLLDLLNIVITLPQQVIRQIFIEVIQIISNYYDITQLQFGGLSPSQIMLSSTGKIKLGMGLYYHYPNINSNSIYHIKSIQKTNLFQLGITHKNFMKNSIEKPLNLELQRSYDIFKIGLIMLQCAVGGFQNFEQSSAIHENIKYIFTQEGQKLIQRDNVCCLIHSQTYLLQFSAQSEEKGKRQKIEGNKSLYYMKLLKDRFSLQFINLLCSCLKLNHSQRATIRDVINHSFLLSESKEAKTVKVNLLDLLQISADENQGFIQSNKEQRLDKFIGHILHVLNNCKRQVLIDLVNNQKETILNLSRDINLHYVGLGQKLYDAIKQMIKTQKKE